MPYFINIGYRFALPQSVAPDGSVVLAGCLPGHQLARRRINHRYPHLASRYFDPQLYLAGLDPAESPQACAYLASYPWFAVQGLTTYDSGQQTQSDWTQRTRRRIATLWPRAAPTGSRAIRQAVESCVDFQLDLGVLAVILPSPLTVDPATDYAQELQWLDEGIRYAASLEEQPPVFATVAITDTCLRYQDPPQNPLLDLILDVVSAREIDGVYLVVEQASEAADARQCTNRRTAWSLLHLVHLFSTDAQIQVGVNFAGCYGLACRAAGADFWASGWYKSTYRLRLADKIAGGRAYPSYWSYPAAVDFHLDNDLDNVVGMLPQIADRTAASRGLLRALASRQRVRQVPAWRYAMSNVAAAAEHFYLSAIQAESALSAQPSAHDHVEQWLTNADASARTVAATLGRASKTKTDHVASWLSAFRAYRTSQGV